MMDHYDDCRLRSTPVSECGCMPRRIKELEEQLDSKNICKHCRVISLLRDVVPHIKYGKRYSEKDPDGGKAARFVDLTLPKHIADKIIEIEKECKKLEL